MFEVLKIVGSIVGITFLVIVELAIIGGAIQNFKLHKLSKVVKSSTEKKMENNDTALILLEEMIEKIEDSGRLAREYYDLESERQKENEDDIPVI